MPSAKKELHLAKSIEELNKKSELENTCKRSVEKVIELSGKLWLRAKDEELEGNEERVYILIFRFIKLSASLDEKDRPTYMRKCGEQIQTAIAKLEALSESLTKRYQEKARIYEERRVEVLGPNATRESKPVPGLSLKVEPSIDKEETNENWYKVITPKQLVDMITSLTLSANLLILDIRETTDFSNSSISAGKFKAPGSLTVINIAGSKIKPGMSCPGLMKILSFGVQLDSLERRRLFHRVIIVDDMTFQFDKSFKSVILADALWKWDQSPDRIKSKPLLMRGGFYNFLLTYPTLTSNSAALEKYSSKQIPIEVFSKEKLATMKFNFDENGDVIMEEEASADEQEEEKFGTPPEEDMDESQSMEVNGSIDLDEANKPLGRLYNFGQLTFNNNLNRPLKNTNLNKVPGVARPVIPDRASKPLFSVNGDTEEQELSSMNRPISISRQNIKAPNINGFHRILNGNKMEVEEEKEEEEESHIADDDEDYDIGVGKFDDDLRGETIKATSNRRDRMQISKQNGYSLETTNRNEFEQEDTNQFNYIPSKSKPINVNDNGNRMAGSSYQNGGSLPQASLSRSLSSPNIAQFGEERQEGAHSFGTPKQAPLIDRSIKPSFPMLSHLYRKSRDFSPQWSTTPRIAGLRNLGNTCFMNAVLQCLNNTAELADHMKITNKIHLNVQSKFGSGGELAIELGELLKQMTQSNFKHLSPKDFKNAVSKHIPDFIDYKQQDAHEFLVRLLDRLHADMNVNFDCQIEDPTLKDPNFYDKMASSTAANSFWKFHRRKHSSIITELFEGLIVSTLMCLQCNYTSKTLEAFTCLSVPVAEGVRTSLKHGLATLLRREMISDETAWNCPTCKQKRDAEKTTVIWKLPKVLVIHLKRFTYEGLWRTKVNSFVDFPLENLVISERDGQIHRSYDLYGVVNHIGSLEGGHYTAYSRNLEDGWHKFDDADVTPLSPADVITQNAYVLFYRMAE